jgi:hypothetical protein
MRRRLIAAIPVPFSVSFCGEGGKRVDRLKTLFTLAASIASGGCGAPLSPPLPPLLEGAHSTGGSNSLCEPGGRHGSTPETASHSPEIALRLRREFPPGTPAARLREALARQGFRLHEPCSPDGSIRWAEFRQSGGNGITAMAAFGIVYWKENDAGRLVWATGDISFIGL